jgi:hypothetical protein
MSIENEPTAGESIASEREKPERNQPSHRAAVNSFPSCELADGPATAMMASASD